MAVDPTKRSLVLTLNFLPYLEKHRVYELFYEIVEDLAKNKPKDPLLHIQALLHQLKTSRECPKIILVAPDHVDRLRLAIGISKKLGVKVLSPYEYFKGNFEDSSPKLYEMLASHLAAKPYSAKGWIFYDFPRNAKEAKEMLKKGIIPTHTFQFIPTKSMHREDDAWNVNLKNWDPQTLTKVITNYRKELQAMRTVLSPSLKEVPIRGKSIEEVVEQCCKMAKTSSYKETRSFPRVVIIGQKGSRKNTIAKMLARKFDLVHVDLLVLIKSATQMEDEMGKKLRTTIMRGARISGESVLALLTSRLLRNDCLIKGWVVTSFPRDVADFQCFTMCKTPPNRVIFLNIDMETYMKRIKDKEVSEYSFNTGNNKVSKDQEQYCKMKALLDYCRGNCSIIDARGSISEVYEMVEAAVLLSAPSFSPDSSKQRLEPLVEKPNITLKDIYPDKMFLSRKTCLLKNKKQEEKLIVPERNY